MPEDQIVHSIESSNTSYVRVLAKCSDAGREDDLLHLDLRLREGKASDRLPVFGWQVDAYESKPFVVRTGGEMDFGSIYEPDRYGRTDLFDVRIAIHSEFSCTGTGYAWKYVIKSIKFVDEMI